MYDSERNTPSEMKLEIDMDIRQKRNIVTWGFFIFGMLSLSILSFQIQPCFCKNKSFHNILFHIGGVFLFPAQLASGFALKVTASFGVLIFVKLSAQAIFYWGLGRIIGKLIFSDKLIEPACDVKNHKNSKSIIVKLSVCFGAVSFLLYWLAFENYLGQETWLFLLGKYFFFACSITSYYSYELLNLLKPEFDVLFWVTHCFLLIYIIAFIVQLLVYLGIGYIIARLVYPNKKLSPESEPKQD